MEKDMPEGVDDHLDGLRNALKKVGHGKSTPATDEDAKSSFDSAGKRAAEKYRQNDE